MSKTLVRASAISREFSIQHAYMKRWADRGWISVKKLGSALLYDPEEVVQFLKDCEEGQRYINELAALGLRRCPECGEIKPVTKFWSGYRRCKDCRKEWYQPYVLQKYGLTYEEYVEILAKQGGTCAVCKQPERELGRGGALKAMSVDHCHKTGRVRGLLCSHCNKRLGVLEDSEWLENALEYLCEA